MMLLQPVSQGAAFADDLAGERANRVVIDLSDQVPAWLVLVLGLGFFVGLFAAIFFVVCLVTSLRGWAGLATRHRGPAQAPASITTTSGLSMMMGNEIAPANYRHVITAGFDGEGLYIRTGSFLKVFHPPIFVPWTGVSEVYRGATIKGEYTAVKCEGLARIVFFGGFADRLHAHWQAREAAHKDSGAGK